jgi:hypothetical protein
MSTRNFDPEQNFQVTFFSPHDAVTVTTGEERAWGHGGKGEDLSSQPDERQRTVFSSC